MGIRATVQMTVNFSEITKQVEARLTHGLNLAAERLLALSAEQVPLDVGTLQESGTVEPATNPEKGAAVVYDTPYSARLHEHPEYNFQNGRQGKYVENPAMENRDELGAIIAKQVNGG